MNQEKLKKGVLRWLTRLAVCLGLVLASGTLIAQTDLPWSVALTQPYLSIDAAAGWNGKTQMSMTHGGALGDIGGGLSVSRFDAQFDLSDEEWGVGVNVENGNWGDLVENRLGLAAAYRINLFQDTRLAFGLSAVTAFSKWGHTFDPQSPEDATLSNESLDHRRIELNTSMFLWSKLWKAGIVINRLWSGVNVELDAMNFELSPEFQTYLSYRFEVSSESNVDILVQSQFVPNQRHITEAALLFVQEGEHGFGPVVRTTGAFGLSAHVRLNGYIKSMRDDPVLSYVALYDQDFGGLSHQIMLNWGLRLRPSVKGAARRKSGDVSPVYLAQ